MKMGHFKRVENKDKKWNENDFYVEGKIQLESGKEIHILLTDHQLQEAIKRSDRNPEDIREDGFFSDLFD